MNSPLSTLAQLEAIEADWLRLTERFGCDNPFLGWGWTHGWCRGADIDGALRVVLAPDGSCILPFMRRGRRIVSLGDPMLADFGEALCRPGDAAELRAAFDGLLREGLPVIAGPVRTSSPTAAAFDEALAGARFASTRRGITTSPQIVLDGSFDAYLARRPKRLRQELRTSASNLGRLGTWSYESTADGADAKAIFPALVEFHRTRQTGKQGRSVFDDDATHAAMAASLDWFPPPSAAHLSAIRLNGRIVSAAYSIRCHDVLYYWVPSFDPGLRGISIGKLHIRCILEECFRHGVRLFDFMGGDEAYKLQWAEQFDELVEYRLYPSALSAARDRLAMAIRESLVGLKRRSKLAARLWFVLTKMRRS